MVSVVATALGAPVFGVGALSLAAASASAALDRDVALAGDALASAQSARADADRRHRQLVGELASLDVELEQQFAGAADLAAEIEAARNQMRRSAITAYVSEGDDRSFDIFNGADIREVSGRRTFSANRTLDWADALDAFQALKEDNDPALVALAERREALATRVADAEDAVFQAGAAEADAERAVARAAQQQAERDAAAATAKQAEAERQARDAKRSATTAPPVARTPAKPAPAAPAPAPGSSIVILTELSAPLPELPPGGPSEAAWAEVRDCESSGNYRAVSRSGRYRGAYQFDTQTWVAMGGLGDPAGALPMEQDARAKFLYVKRGARAWPQCGLALL